MKDIRKATLDAIVKDGEVTGFKVDGFDNGRMDGYGYHLAIGEISITPAPSREDAPDVFCIEEHHYFEEHRDTNEFRKSYIVLGAQKAIQKAYQLALEFATMGVESRNSWIEWANKCGNLGTITGRATLVDNAKDKLKI
jgi:hypothetical protein